MLASTSWCWCLLGLLGTYKYIMMFAGPCRLWNAIQSHPFHILFVFFSLICFFPDTRPWNRFLWICFLLFFSFLFLALVCEFCLSIQLYCFTIFFQLLKFGFPFHFFFKLFISCLCFFLFLLVGYNRPSVNQLSFASHFLHCSSVSTLHTLKKSTNETSSFVLSP